MKRWDVSGGTVGAAGERRAMRVVLSSTRLDLQLAFAPDVATGLEIGSTAQRLCFISSKKAHSSASGLSSTMRKDEARTENCVKNYVVSQID